MEPIYDIKDYPYLFIHCVIIQYVFMMRYES